MAVTAKGKPGWSQELHPDLSGGYRGRSTQSIILCCFLRCISSELDWSGISRTQISSPYGMLVGHGLTYCTTVLPTTHPFWRFIYLFESQSGGEKERDLASAALLPRCLQSPGLGHPATRSQEHHRVSHLGDRGPVACHLLLSSQVQWIAKTWIVLQYRMPALQVVANLAVPPYQPPTHAGSYFIFTKFQEVVLLTSVYFLVSKQVKKCCLRSHN